MDISVGCVTGRTRKSRRDKKERSFYFKDSIIRPLTVEFTRTNP